MYTVINNVIKIVKRSVSLTTASTRFKAHITDIDEIITNEKNDRKIGSLTFFRMSGIFKNRKDKNIKLTILR